MIAARIMVALLFQVLAVAVWAQAGDQNTVLVTRLDQQESRLAMKSIRADDPNRLSELLTLRDSAGSLGVSFPFSGGDKETRLCNRFDLRIFSNTPEAQISCRVVIQRPGASNTFEFYLFGVDRSEEANDFYCKSVAKLGHLGWLEKEECHRKDIEWVLPGVSLSNSGSLISRISRILDPYRKFIDLRILEDRPATGLLDQMERIEVGQRVHQGYINETVFNNSQTITCDEDAIYLALFWHEDVSSSDDLETLNRTCLENLRQHLLQEETLQLIRHNHSRRTCDNVTFTTSGPGNFEVRCQQLQQDTGRTDQPHYEPWIFSLVVKDGEVDEQCWNWKPINMSTGQQADTSTPLENCDGGFIFVW